MTLSILQCFECKYGNTLKRTDEDIYICSQYEKGIPEVVEMGTGDCFKFEEKSNG